MISWKTCTINDIGTVVGGATPSTKDLQNYEGGTIPWITPKDLAGYSGRFISHGERNITEKGLRSCSAQIMPTHSILFSSRAPIGYIAISEGEVCTNQGFKSVVPNEDTDYMFLYYLLKFNKNKIEHLGSGTTFKEVSGSTMRSVEVRVPESIDDQRRIASILSTLDEKIEKNSLINRNLEEQAKAIYRTIVENSVETVLLSEIMTIKHGYAFKGEYISADNNNIILVTPGNFKIGGGFQEGKGKYYTGEYSEDYVLKAGDLIVTMTDLSKQADTLGYGALVPDNPDKVYLHNQRIGLIKFIKGDYLKDYIYWYLRSYDYHMGIVGSSSGSTVKHTSPGRILEQSVSMPHSDDMDKIIILRDIDIAVSKNDVEKTRLSNIRDTLLPKLMSGELDVSDIDL